MKQYYIYLTTHLTNGKKYIGQHYGELNDNYFGSGTIILKILASEGTKNLKKDILCICTTREEADQKEKEYIQLFDAVNSSEFYNLSEGGTGGDGWRAYQAWGTQHPNEAMQQYQENGKRLQDWIRAHPEEYHEKVVLPGIEATKKWRDSHPKEVQQHMIKVNEAKEKWQQEHQEEHRAQIEKWRQAGAEANKKQVRCITTGEIFESVSAAARSYARYGVQQSNISKVLKGERKSCGKINGKKLEWEWVTE